MGYFSTHVEADRSLKSLRVIYPGAFVSDVSAAQAKLLGDTQVTAITTGTTSTSAVCATSARHRPGRTFKETLEILGASALATGSDDEVNDTRVHRNLV